MRRLIARIREFKVRREVFPWPHWEFGDGQGRGVLLWPWKEPHVCDVYCPWDCEEKK